MLELVNVAIGEGMHQFGAVVCSALCANDGQLAQTAAGGCGIADKFSQSALVCRRGAKSSDLELFQVMALEEELAERPVLQCAHLVHEAEDGELFEPFSRVDGVAELVEQGVEHLRGRAGEHGAGACINADVEIGRGQEFVLG